MSAGEFCGAVFWLKLNQRLHRLDPDNETFVGEIEREVFNEGLAHLAPAVSVTPFVVKARPMGLRTGLDPSRLHDLADDLEAETFVVTTRKLRKALKK